MPCALLKMTLACDDWNHKDISQFHPIKTKPKQGKRADNILKIIIPLNVYYLVKWYYTLSFAAFLNSYVGMLVFKSIFKNSFNSTSP
jgi:hypothetical protein